MAAREASDSDVSEEGAALKRIAESRVGTTLADKWTLDAFLGMGGSGSVYAAHHRNGRRAAVKILHSEHALRPRLRRRFRSEGCVANRVGHPDVVAVLDDGEEPDGTMFLVMELLSGISFAEKLARQGPLPDRDVIDVGVRVLSVLAAAHDEGIVHRDMKPSNIFLTEDGAVKVLDFGSARLNRDDNSVTLPGAVFGTPSFMPPELAAGRTDEVDARTDIWTVGATMFQLLTGATVHATRSRNEALVVAATRRARHLASVAPNVDPKLAAIVDRALCFERSGRWPNAHAMKAALARLAGGDASCDGGFSTMPEEARLRWGSTRRGRAVRTGIAAMAVALLLIGAKVTKTGSHARTLRIPPPPNGVAQEPTTEITLALPARSGMEIPVAPSEKTALGAAGAASSRTHPRQAVPATAASSWMVDEVLDRRK
jgi:serine/threonine protein kinase